MRETTEELLSSSVSQCDAGAPSLKPALHAPQACIALTYPDRIHSFHLQHLAQPPADPSSALVGDSARAAPPPSDELQALLKSLALTADQRAVLICLRRM